MLGFASSPYLKEALPKLSHLWSLKLHLKGSWPWPWPWRCCPL